MKISLKSLQLIKHAQIIALMFFLSSFAVVESQRFLVVVVFFPSDYLFETGKKGDICTRYM